MSAVCRGTFANERTRVPPLSLSLYLRPHPCAGDSTRAADLNDPFHNARLLQTYKGSLETRRLRRGRLRNFGGGASRAASASGDFTRR